MPTYYVDLGIVGISGSGTSEDPWSIENFLGNLNTSGNVFNVKGQGQSSNSFNVNANITIQNWLSSPWRFKSTGTSFFGATDAIIKNGIIDILGAVTFSGITTYLYDCFFISETSTYTQDNGSPVFIGCTIISPTAGQDIACSCGGLISFVDSIVSVNSFVNNPSSVSAINSVFKTSAIPSGGTNINNQFSWTPPSWPAWDAAESAFDSAILSVKIQGPPYPEPGVGYPAYTGYPTGLWGTSRIGIGAVDFTPTYKNLPADINVIDFKISNIAEPVLSSDFTQVTLVFTGVANPENSDASLIDYQYSLDNGVTWFPMTAAAGSDLTGLVFNPAGLPYNFVWAIKEDIGNYIYNIPIRIKFLAQATFGSDILQTAYKLKTITIVKTVIIPEVNVTPIFPADYTGVSGNTLLTKKPLS